MTAPADLAEVRAALAPVAKATSGPWRTFGRWPNLAVVSGSDRPRIVASLASASDAVDDTPKDAAAIVALRNAAPAISAAVEELTAARAEIARQRETIRAGADAVRSANASTTEIGGRLDAAGERIAALEADVAKRDAEIAALRRQVCRLTSGDEIEGDRLCQHHGADVAALALLSDERAAHAETSRDLDALLTALGAQVTPGGQTEDACQARRVADGMRRARDLVAAREVPADVEAAIRTLVDGVHFCALEIDDPKAAEGSPGFPGWPDMGAPMVIAFRAAIAKAIADGRADIQAAPHDVEVAIADLVAASRDLEVYAEGKVTAKRTRSAERSFGRARTALRAAIAAEIERARAEGRGEAAAAPATVGGLLATIDEDSQDVIEFFDHLTGVWTQIGLGPCIGHRVHLHDDGGWGSEWDEEGIAHRWFAMPARLVPASEADADPASRGPIAAKETDDAR